MMNSCILVWDSISLVKPCKLLLLMPVDLGIFQKYSELLRYGLPRLLCNLRFSMVFVESFDS